MPQYFTVFQPSFRTLFNLRAVIISNVSVHPPDRLCSWNNSTKDDPILVKSECCRMLRKIVKKFQFSFLSARKLYLHEFLACTYTVYKLLITYQMQGARGTVVGWGAMLQSGRSRVQVPMRSLDFFNWPNPSSRTMALGSTQPLTEMSTGN
jgi:hypothetical protein